VASAARGNWLSSLNWQIDFYRRARPRPRVDSEFDYAWFEGSRGSNLRVAAGRVARRLRLRPPAPSGITQPWVSEHAGLLWESRGLMADELSRLLFDSMLVLACSSHRQFYFPRLEFDDILTVARDEPFVSTELPRDYLGLPLRVFTLQLTPPRAAAAPLTVISTREEMTAINSYRQYFLRRGADDFMPGAGDVVLDCGACIGDVSILMAGLVGVGGEVHLFDPVPLHARFCRLQASLNPGISHVFHMNGVAVGEMARETTGPRTDATAIAPAGVGVDAYATMSLDQYVSGAKMRRVDMVKMDIEGAEVNALQGASGLIREFVPRLAIAAYHEPRHLWEIPHAMKAQNQNYRLFFGHHSPVAWESVYYAAPPFEPIPRT
jgi:FkbM family methyltransferase